MPSPPRIAVTGATGGLGGRVAARLAMRGVAQRLIVRDASRAPQHDGAEVRVIGGYADADGLRTALADIDTLLFVPGEESLDRVRQHLTVVDAAVAAGVRHVVYLSFVGAASDSTFILGRHHAATEEIIRSSGLAFTFLRMNFYLDVLPLFAGADGAIRGPAGDGHVAAVSRDDLADVAVAVLTGEGHEGAVHDVTGGEALTLGQAAAIMAHHSGRPIHFVDETLEEAEASRASFGAPAWQVEAWISTYTAIADGDVAEVTDTVRRLTGQEPITLDAYLEANPGALDHVTSSPA